MSIHKINFKTLSDAKVATTTLYTHVIQNLTDTTALAIWTYLSSKPPNWVVNKTQLRSHFGISEKKLNNSLSLLKKLNLISYIRYKNSNGTFQPISIDVLTGIPMINK
jgi:RIO-like serine/threonine protein kinase